MSAALLPSPSLLARVRQVQAAHLRQTGRNLSTDDALRTLDRIAADRRAYLERRGYPLPRWLYPVLELLLEWGYTPGAIDEILPHLGRHRTTAGCPALDPEDREMVRALLPADDRPADAGCDCPHCGALRAE